MEFPDGSKCLRHVAGLWRLALTAQNAFSQSGADCAPRNLAHRTSNYYACSGEDHARGAGGALPRGRRTGTPDADRAEISKTKTALGDWIAEGFDLEADIVPIIRERTARERSEPIWTWGYFTKAIRHAHRQRLARGEPAQPAREDAGIHSDAGSDATGKTEEFSASAT
jgi:hypothetical protein